jgi:RNA polymerase sigma factor (sigma-70 family)
MVVNILKILAKDHKKWVNIVKSFGLTDDAEDLVQEMYLKIHYWNGKYDKTLMFNDHEVNYYFIFRVLRNLFLDRCKTKKRHTNLDYAPEPLSKDISLEFKQELEVIKNEIKSWHLYDRKIYELVFLENKSMLELSKQTGIDYYSIYRTVKKIKKLILEKIEK